MAEWGVCPQCGLSLEPAKGKRAAKHEHGPGLCGVCGGWLPLDSSANLIRHQVAGARCPGSEMLPEYDEWPHPVTEPRPIPDAESDYLFTAPCPENGCDQEVLVLLPSRQWIHRSQEAIHIPGSSLQDYRSSPPVFWPTIRATRLAKPRPDLKVVEAIGKAKRAIATCVFCTHEERWVAPFEGRQLERHNFGGVKNAEVCPGGEGLPGKVEEKGAGDTVVVFLGIAICAALSWGVVWLLTSIVHFFRS